MGTRTFVPCPGPGLAVSVCVGMALSVDVTTLKSMNQAELDDLFVRSPAGPIPAGQAEGTVLFAPGSPIEDLAARVAHAMFWKGKIFDPASGELHNRILPEGIPAIAARVYRAPSWIDGRDCIVLDYSQTSIVAHHVRDEIREVAPGLYLGVVFWDRRKILNFALDFGR
jgi:hypothetical protein